MQRMLSLNKNGIQTRARDAEDVESEWEKDSDKNLWITGCWVWKREGFRQEQVNQRKSSLNKRGIQTRAYELKEVESEKEKDSDRSMWIQGCAVWKRTGFRQKQVNQRNSSLNKRRIQTRACESKDVESEKEKDSDRSMWIQGCAVWKRAGFRQEFVIQRMLSLNKNGIQTRSWDLKATESKKEKESDKILRSKGCRVWIKEGFRQKLGNPKGIESKWNAI